MNAPGRESESRVLKKGYQTGIISSITVNPVDPDFYALGSYDKTVALYDDVSGEIQCLIQAHRGGVTHIMFSADGFCLYTGARQDGKIFCWDLRNPEKTLFTIERTARTCQRIYFDLNRDASFLATGRYINLFGKNYPCEFFLIGSTMGDVDIYDTKKPPNDKSMLEKNYSWRAHQDSSNSISINPIDDTKIATGSGQRHLKKSWSDDESSDEDCPENCVKVWSVKR